ncbi:MAG: hypothetical protein AAFR35_11460 [Pseudomonadota bacterium]
MSAPQAGIGHNQGPTMERGAGWRRYAWRKARAELLPKLPLEIVRIRVKRARELGLDYKSYASVRAASGRDVVAFLFSSNALRVTRRGAEIEPGRAAKLEGLVRCGRVALVQPPLRPADLDAAGPGLFEAIGPAPTLGNTWSELRARLAAVTADRGVPGDGVIVVGDTALEREWLAAGRFAAYLSAERYFGELS